MKADLRHITLYSIRIFLMVFWLYVALDKLWDLSAFHRALLKQPFPNWWADILYWALPLAELAIALLFTTGSTFFVIQQNEATSESGKRRVAIQKNPRHPDKLYDVRFWGFLHSTPFVLSSLLLLTFTIYIALGVMGFYAQRPCGCASVFSGLSWDWHLLANIVLLSLSILGRFLCGSSEPTDHGIEQYAHAGRGQPTFIVRMISLYRIFLFILKRFPRRFALFPGRPVDE